MEVTVITITIIIKIGTIMLLTNKDMGNDNVDNININNEKEIRVIIEVEMIIITIIKKQK